MPPGFTGIPYDCCRIHYCRDTDCQYRNPHSLFINSISVIPYTAPRSNARITDLNGGIKPLSASGCQRIDNDQQIRLGILYYACHHFRSLNTGFSHNPRLHGTDTGYCFGISLFSIYIQHMSGYSQMVKYFRSQSISCYSPVSQPHDHNTFIRNISFILQKLFDLFCQELTDLFMKTAVILCKSRYFHCNIGSYRFSHTLCSIFSLNIHPGDHSIYVFSDIFLNRNSCQFSFSGL